MFHYFRDSSEATPVIFRLLEHSPKDRMGACLEVADSFAAGMLLN